MKGRRDHQRRLGRRQGGREELWYDERRVGSFGVEVGGGGWEVGEVGGRLSRGRRDEKGEEGEEELSRGGEKKRDDSLLLQERGREEEEGEE